MDSSATRGSTFDCFAIPFESFLSISISIAIIIRTNAVPSYDRSRVTSPSQAGVMRSRGAGSAPLGALPFCPLRAHLRPRAPHGSLLVWPSRGSGGPQKKRVENWGPLRQHTFEGDLKLTRVCVEEWLEVCSGEDEVLKGVSVCARRVRAKARSKHPRAAKKQRSRARSPKSSRSVLPLRRPPQTRSNTTKQLYRPPLVSWRPSAQVQWVSALSARRAPRDQCQPRPRPRRRPRSRRCRPNSPRSCTHSNVGRMRATSL